MPIDAQAPASGRQEHNLIVAVIVRAILDYLFPHRCPNAGDRNSAVEFVEGEQMNQLCSIVGITPKKTMLMSIKLKSFEEREQFLQDMRLIVRKTYRY